jgi:hypothetical protein
MGNYPDCMKITLQTVDNDNNESSEAQYVAVSDILNEIKSANMTNGNPVTSDIDPCRFKDYTNPISNAKKTKEVCEPEKDEFSLLRSSESNSESDSSSDSSSDSDSDSDSGKNKKRAKKEKKKEKKQAKKDKKTQAKNKNGDSIAQSQYVPANNATGAYDSMSITNDTMFDDYVSAKTYHYRTPDDTPTRIYYAAITAIGLYLLYRLLQKKQK